MTATTSTVPPVLAEAVLEAVAAVVEADIADFLVDAEAVLHAGLAHDLAGAHAVIVFGAAADPEIEVPVVHLRLSRVSMTPTGMPAALAFMTASFSAVASGIETTMRVRLGGDGGVDQARHLHHVEGLGRMVFDLAAHGRLAGLDAVLHHRPVDVVRLAVRDEDDVDVLGLLRLCQSAGRARRKR